MGTRIEHSNIETTNKLTFHGGLESIDRVNFSNEYSSSKSPQALGTSFSNISIASDHTHLQQNYHWLIFVMIINDTLLY